MQQRFSLFFIFLFHILSVSIGIAQEKNTFLLDSLKKRQYVHTSYFQIWIDKQGLSLDEVIKKEETIQWLDSIAFSQKTQKAEKKDKPTVWAKTSLKNPYPIPMTWVVILGGGNIVEAYYPTEKNKWIEKKLGFFRARSQNIPTLK